MAAVQAGKNAGKTVDDLVTGWTNPPGYAGYVTPQPAQLRAPVQTVYDELK